MTIVAEQPWLWAGLAAYTLAFFVSVWGMRPAYAAEAVGGQWRYQRIVLVLLVSGVLLLMMAIAQRWMRIGHGPWINLFELLMSQLWSLGLILSLIYWRIPGIRPSAIVILPVMAILGTWVLTLEPANSHFPATYYNSWKWFHVGLGKVFLALLLIGVGLAGVLLLRKLAFCRVWFRHMAADAVVDKVAWRFMMLALVFDSMMLVAGAVWAQDAWGRYWAWDALETSSFLTWMALGLGLHLRVTYKVPYWLSASMIIGIFILAFTTYFGTPYITPAAHKGVI